MSDGNRNATHLRRRVLACENRLYNIYLDDISDPSGESVSDYLVVAPKRGGDDLLTGVAVLPVLKGHFGLLRLFRHPLGREIWELPRGGVEPGEAPVRAGQRELEEETGLACLAEAMVPLAIMAPDAGVIAGCTAIFAATACVARTEFAATEMGHRELRFFAPEELRGMVEGGEIEDSHCLIAWYAYAARNVAAD